MKKITLALLFLVFALTANAIYYVVPGGAGALDGSSWGNAASSIQSTIDAASAVYGSTSTTQEVWVKAGTYSTSSAAILMKLGVNVYGGFDGTETDKSQRAKGSNPWNYSNVSILDGGNTKRCIESATNFASITIIDGFTLTNGNGVGTQLSNNGGGALLRENLKLQNCIVTNNTATGNGGGVNAVGGIISNCWIYNNTTTSSTIPSAGGIYSSPASGITTSIENSLIERNSQGAVRFQGTGSNITMDRCVIRNNTSTGNGAAIYVNGAPASCQISNCVISNNSGGNNIYLQKAKLINSTIANNEGGIYLASATNIGELYNNIIVNNNVISATTATSVSVVAGFPTDKVKNNAVYPAIDAQSWGGASNSLLISDVTTAMTGISFESATTFVGATSDATKLTEIANAKWNLFPESKAINFGDNSLIPSGITLDFAANNRINDVTVDAGAYENVQLNVNENQNSTDLSLDETTDIFVKSGGNLIINSASTVKNLTVAAGGKVTLTAGLSLNNLNLHSDAENTATFVNNGSALTLSAKVRQNLGKDRMWYVSSPVTAATAAVLSSNDNEVAWYDETQSSGWTTIAASTALSPGKGYALKTSSLDRVPEFTGTINDGNIDVNLTNTTASGNFAGYNLLGNPYPSFLDIESLVNSNSNLEKSIWYRSHNGTAMVFDIVNLTDAGASVSNSGRAKVTGIIPPMQAFWLKTSANTTLTFTNAMRAHTSVNATSFKAPSNPENQYLKLQVSNGVNSDQCLIYFNALASDTKESFDTYKMSNNNTSIPEIYTLIEGQRMVINGMELKDRNIEIPLGFSTGESNKFTLKATEMTNLGTNMKVYLNDKLLNTSFEIIPEQSYTFNSEIVNSADRFSVLFKSAEGVSSTEIQSIKANVYVNENREIVVETNENSKVGTIISLYNVSGQKMMQKVTATEREMLTVHNPGIYLVKIENQSLNVYKISVK